MSDLTPDEQALIDSGEYMLPKDIVREVAKRIPEIKDFYYGSGEASFWLKSGTWWRIRFAVYKIPNIYPSTYVQSCVMELTEIIRRESSAS